MIVGKSILTARLYWFYIYIYIKKVLTALSALRLVPK